METAIADTQRKDGDVCGNRGSWDPQGPWAEEGGRVFSSAAAVLALNFYYRYDSTPFHEELELPPPPPPPPFPTDLPPRLYAPCR